MAKTCDSVLDGEPSIDELVRYAKSIGVRDDHDAQSLAHDALLDDRAKGFRFRKIKFLAYNYFDRVLKPREENLTYLEQTLSDDGLTYLDLLEYDDSNEIRAELQASQRQLIEQLTTGTDDRTTLIVQTFLETDKPTIANVAKELNLHRQVVTRCVRRLARNYSESEHGALADYLTA